MNEYLTTFNAVLGGGVLTVLAAIYNFAKLSTKLDTVDKKQDKLEHSMDNLSNRMTEMIISLNKEISEIKVMGIKGNNDEAIHVLQAEVAELKKKVG